MLAEAIFDPVESKRGNVDGLGLLPANVTFGPEKVLAREAGTALGERVDGYLIHHGEVSLAGGEPFLDGCTAGSVTGTTWHGIFEADGFRRAFLRDLAARTGRDFVVAEDVSFARVRERRVDTLADLVEENLDTRALTELIENGAPRGLPLIDFRLVQQITSAAGDG
jgi:adenosylcobyric acid synthase